MAALEGLEGVVFGAMDLPPALCFAIEVDKGVLSAAGKVEGTELREETSGVEGDAEIGLSGKKKARNTIPDSGVCVGRVWRVGVDIHAGASCFSGLTAIGTGESVGTHAATNSPENDARTPIGTRRASYAGGWSSGPSLSVLPRQNNKSDWNDYGGNYQTEEDDQEENKGPERHSTAFATGLSRIDLGLQV